MRKLIFSFFQLLTYTAETCIEYIEKWSIHFKDVMIFAWCALDQQPEWKFIEASAKFISAKQRFDIESCDTELFDQFTYLKKYVSENKIHSWEENNVTFDQRWVECFQNLAKNNIPFNHISKIVAYILSLPGTSASVERLFSIINDVWSTEKTRLDIKTLRDILYVRYNIKMSCLEFFNFIKNQSEILEQIGSTDKYAFKNRNDNVSNE